MLVRRLSCLTSHPDIALPQSTLAAVPLSALAGRCYRVCIGRCALGTLRTGMPNSIVTSPTSVFISVPRQTKRSPNVSRPYSSRVILSGYMITISSSYQSYCVVRWVKGGPTCEFHVLCCCECILKVYISPRQNHRTLCPHPIPKLGGIQMLATYVYCQLPCSC